VGGVMSTVYCSLHDIPTPTKDSSNLGSYCPRKERTTKEYIERFNKEVVQVWGISERMKKYLLERGLWKGSDFDKANIVEEPRNLRVFE